MANTFELIATQSVTAGGGAASVSFTSIPATFTDICIKFSARVARTPNTTTPLWVIFNGDTGTNYDMKLLYGSGTLADTLSYNISYLIAGYVNAAGSTASTFTNGEIYIPNYAGSTQKSISVDAVTENNATAATASLTAGRWTGTAAITSIEFSEGNGPSNIDQYSNFYLYGIKNS